MCGACGNYSVKDWSWPWLDGSRSATLIARAAERLSRIRSIRILPAPNGWQVLLPTGSTHLVQSVTALVLLAQVDSTVEPDVLLSNSPEIAVRDRRRTIVVRVANSHTPPSDASETWPDTLMSPETTSVTIDGSSTMRLLRGLEELAQTAFSAPCRDHIRLLPVSAEITERMEVNRWTDFPENIRAGELPVLCLSLAARLVSLPRTDTRFREARVGYDKNGTVTIQSVGHTVIALHVDHAAFFGN